MIGYKKDYNCSQHAVSLINKSCGAEFNISAGEEWQVDFIRMLRDRFKPIKKPKENCLVVMNDMSGSFHLGVYHDFMIEHNYKPLSGSGHVIMSDIGTIRSLFKRVRFYAYCKTV